MRKLAQALAKILSHALFFAAITGFSERRAPVLRGRKSSAVVARYPIFLQPSGVFDLWARRSTIPLSAALGLMSCDRIIKTP
jgi:hypothetical protein